MAHMSRNKFSNANFAKGAKNAKEKGVLREFRSIRAFRVERALEEKSSSISFIILALLASTLAGCAAPVIITPTPAWATVTVDPFGTVTATPFQPESNPPTNTPLPVPTATTYIQPTLAPTDTQVPVTPPDPVVRTKYSLSVIMDYSAHSLGVTETITYTNQTGEALGNLLLAVEPNRWSGAFWLSSLTLNGQPTGNHSLNGIRLDIPLAQPLSDGGTVTIDLVYDLYLPQTSNDHIFGYNYLQLNLIDWYPFIVPYVPGQGWLLNEPFVTGEHLVYDPADFEVRIRQSDPSLAATIAASAPAQADGDGFSYRLENARIFVFSASTRYLSTSASLGNITITSYYTEGHADAAAAILQAATQAVALYSDLYAPYPYASLNIVEAAFPDGMEADGLVWLSRNFYDEYNGTVRNNLISIGVHEISHQWWFGLVGNDQALEPWLDEALCTYSEWIFYMHTYPSLAGWWWNFRVKPFSPSGYINITIYEGGSFRPYVNAVYLRGAYFMDALRLRVGDDAFYAFLKDYATQMSHRRASRQDFFSILAQHTNIDISGVVGDYFK